MGLGRTAPGGFHDGSAAAGMKGSLRLKMFIQTVWGISSDDIPEYHWNIMEYPQSLEYNGIYWNIISTIIALGLTTTLQITSHCIIFVNLVHRFGVQCFFEESHGGIQV